MKVGFAGAGNMAAAMARGWAAAPGEPEEMGFCDLDRDRAQGLSTEVGGKPFDSLPELRDWADVVVLAVKPAALDSVASELGGRAPALISILAATPVAALAEAFPGVPAVRAMPNQPVAVGRGVVCYVEPSGDAPADLSGQLVALLGALGAAVVLPEEAIDAAMAVMSCSPAYIALFAEALAKAGVGEGLDAETAAELVSGTLAGTAELLQVQAPAAIRSAVAPPGGATEAGLDALDRAGFAESIAAAVEASLERFR